MTIRFIHAADIHLGYEQYNDHERFLDFGRAFEALVDDALARRVDFLLIAGDLFHKHQVDPQAMLHATHHLRRLQKAHIPAVAIEGNHERSPYGERLTWLDFLAEEGLLILLNPPIEEQRIVMDAWQGSYGAFVDLLGQVRVIGMKYYGAATPRMVAELAQALAALPGPRPAYTVLMLHAGLQGILDNYSATLTRAQLEPLRTHCDYLALGHIHKPFAQDDWLYNPGSLETNSAAEAEWDERGYFLVEVAPGETPPHRVTRLRGRRRAFERLRFVVDGYNTPDDLYRGLDAYLLAQASPARVAQCPVVELQLTGTLAFERADLDTAQLAQSVQAAFRPLHCILKDLTIANAFEIQVTETLSRAEVELHVLRELVERDVRRRPQSESWARMILDLKRLALEDSPPTEVVAALRAFRATLGEEDAPC